MLSSTTSKSFTIAPEGTHRWVTLAPRNTKMIFRPPILHSHLSTESDQAQEELPVPRRACVEPSASLRGTPDVGRRRRSSPSPAAAALNRRLRAAAALNLGFATRDFGPGATLTCLECEGEAEG